MRPEKDGDFEYLIEPNATVTDLPVEGLEEVNIPGIRDETELRTPGPLPRLYTGDVAVGLDDGGVTFVYLLKGDVDAGIEVIPLQTGMHELIGTDELTALFLGVDELVVYDDVFHEFEGWGEMVTVDEDNIPEVGPTRKQR